MSHQNQLVRKKIVSKWIIYTSISLINGDKKKIRFFHHEPKTTNGPNIFVVNKWQIFLSNCFAGENDTKLSCQNAQIIILYLWQAKICVGR